MNEKDQIRCLRRLYSKFRASCKNRGIENKLTREEHKELVLGECKYCGSDRLNSNKLKYSGLEFRYNGIDRKDSGRGYYPGNCLSSCRFCNSLKGSMKWKTWAGFLNDVVVNHGGRPPFAGTEQDSDRSGKSFFNF